MFIYLPPRTRRLISEALTGPQGFDEAYPPIELSKGPDPELYNIALAQYLCPACSKPSTQCPINCPARLAGCWER